MTGTIAVIMIFSIPILGIITNHLKDSHKIKASMLKDQLELEKLKYDNFIVETEKMRLELETMKVDYTKTEVPIFIEVPGEKTIV